MRLFSPVRVTFTYSRCIPVQRSPALLSHVLSALPEILLWELKMFGGIPFRICALILTSASSAALNFRPGSGQLDPLTIHQSANITDLETLILNGPAPHLGSSEPRCLASFGTPPLSSCQEALSFIPRNRQQVTFGQRRSIGFVDHVMPYDLISCKLISFIS